MKPLDKNAILIDLSESDRTDFGRRDFAAQSLPQRVFSSIWALEAEVNNGGFSHYFFNSSSDSVAFVVEALTSIGAPLTAELCKRAIESGFPNGLPPTPEEISLAAAEFDDTIHGELECLDSDFFAYPNDLTTLLFDYVSSHPEEFGDICELYPG